MTPRFGSRASLFSPPQLETLLERALEVLARTPFRIQGTDEFSDDLRAFGCGVDGEEVSFPRSVMDRVLGRMAEARSAVAASRSGTGKHAELATGEQQSESDDDAPLCMATHGQALHICDTRSNDLRPATTADLARWCRMVDSLGEVGRDHPTFIPTDVPRGTGDLHAFTTVILNSRAPHRVSVYSARMLPFFIQAQAVVEGSEEEVKKRPIFATKCWVNSPFMVTRENIEIAMDARRLLGAPVIFGLMPVAGASSPVTVAGALVQNTAEMLAISVMSLALGGELQHLPPPGAVLDFRYATHRQSGPDYLLHRIASADMEEHLFGRRPAVGIPGVSAQTVSAQSLYEKAQAATTSLLLGIRRLGIGCLAYSDVGSPVQLVLDYEMGCGLRHTLREVSADDDHIGIESILATIPRGAAYMETEHTARYFREESWIPGLLDPRPPLAWRQDPTDMIETAREKAVSMEERAENQCPLTEQQRSEIRRIEQEAIRAAGAG